MPKILDRYVKGLEKSGRSEGSSFAIATSILQKKGVLKKGTQELSKNWRDKVYDKFIGRK